MAELTVDLTYGSALYQAAVETNKKDLILDEAFQVQDIFEREPVKPGFLPAAREPELLPQCDLVILSSTTLINKTAEQILGWCTKARQIVMVGATTPMAPEVLRRYGITALAGTKITDADTAMRIVMQGGGAMDLAPASEKLFETI